MTQRQQIVLLRGGLDIVSPPLEIGQGFCIGALNYESEARGYRRVQGRERYDGQLKPSEAQYWVLDFDAGQTAIVAGNVVTGATSGATGIVLLDATPDTGTWAGGDATGTLALSEVSGEFEDDEALQVSASTVATADGASIQTGAINETLDATYKQAAIERRRALIAAVPGSGGILGVCTYRGTVYAFRNNAGGTAAIMHKATSSGWQAQSFGHMIDFTGGGTATMVEGETITGTTSGATATVERIGMLGGAWSGTAEGYLVLSGITGTFQAAETITGGTTGATATATAAQEAIALPPGGKYRTVVHNFFGVSKLSRLYGANGEGPAFEWDGSVLAPIRKQIDASLDKPRFISVHANHLLTGYDGGSILYSGTGEPLDARSVAGGGEIGFGQDLTGLKSSTRTATIIAGRNKLGYLQGNDTANFNLSFISEDSGAFADTLEVVGEPYFLDDLGVRSLRAAQTFGDWSIGAISRLVEPMIRRKREKGIVPVGAVRVRAKSQYRLVYSDGSGLNAYFGRKNPEFMPFDLAITPTAVHSGEDNSGNEILFVGDDEGMVYQLDSGNGADGADIEAYLRVAYMHQGMPNRDKRYHRALVDVIGGGPDTEIFYSSDYSYGDPDQPSGAESQFAISGAGGFWDSAIWDEFYWDAPDQSQAKIELNGIGQNVTLAFMSDRTYEEPHTLASITINYTLRRTQR